MKNIGIYIHIPFCVQKCYYCDFISYTNKTNCIDEYVKKLKEEIKSNLLEKEYKIKTIYIGGGTPSCIESKYIKEILETIKLYNKSIPLEITIEVNPGTVTKEKLLDYFNVGINRLSIGLQETDNSLLNSIGRIHKYEEFLNTYNMAREVGFKNINVDLIIGLPNQTICNIKSSLEKVLELKSEHISVYSLILEEGTKLYYMYNNKEIILPEEELERNMYWYVKNYLENNGYVHYEISNFCKRGYESKHNLDCWNQQEYIGFGVAAHSYINGARYSNTDNLEQYINKPIEYIIHEEQTKEEIEKEYMLLGLRKIEGIGINEFKNKFGKNPIFLFKEELNELVNKKLIIVDGDRIKLSIKGLDLANKIWEKFI